MPERGVAVPVAVVHLEPAIGGATVKAGLGQLALAAEPQADWRRLGSFPGVTVDFLTDEPTLARLKPILKDTFRLEMTHLPTLEESCTLMRRNARQIARSPWGLSYSSSFPRKSLGPVQFFETLFPMKPAKWGLAGADSFDREIDRAHTFVLIRTSGNHRTAQIQAGMVFQRMRLQAINEGFADAGETIQMIAAIGVASFGFAAEFRIPTDGLVRP